MNEAKEFLMEQWGDKGAAVIEECAKFPPLYMNSMEFLDHCYTCGGNWAGMLLTGIKKLRPSIWEVIPEKMGHMAFACMCYVLQLCGVDTSK